MSDSEQFLVLDELYVSRFDEIVVIGDIHGCHDEFEELLDKVHSESPTKLPDKCLKILVGDLVNKGPKSKEVLRTCKETYPNSILAVRGNHDEIVVNAYENSKKLGVQLEERNKWIETIPTDHIMYLKSLPYTISIPSLNSIIVHAGLNPSIKDPVRCTDTRLMITMRNIVVETDEHTNEINYHCVKSEKEGTAWAAFWPGPEHVYFGHDARRRLQDNHKFATGLDTGCVYGDRLSYIYLKGQRKGQIFSVKAKKIYEPVSD